MNSIFKVQFFSFLVLLLASNNTYAKEPTKSISIYPIGIVKHFELRPETNDGNLNYFAASISHKKNVWNFENGIGTFIDTYHKRAFVTFTDISHDRYRYGLLTPVINFHCAYKGYSYSSNKRRVQCYPLFKVRIGKQKGLFTNIIPLPKIGDVTNGLVAFEIGYKF